MTKSQNANLNNKNRRAFLKNTCLSTLPFWLPLSFNNSDDNPIVNSKTNMLKPELLAFYSDGLFFRPQDYLAKLTEINEEHQIKSDFYGRGGVTEALEKKFAEVTGKEKAIYLPSGTMANQLAIKLLNGNNTKVLVPENSHIFRDEADAAQSVHGKRLIPLGKGKAYFNLDDVKEIIAYNEENEVFKSGLGTIAIECPIRRADGVAIPIETIAEISKYCKENGYKLHLDGARLHIASAYTKVSVEEYSSYFDTVYISLYKYLNADGGAILCGDANIIDQVSHQIKILGGTVFRTWQNTAMAYHYLEGIEDRWSNLLNIADALISKLNKVGKVNITPIKNGTNIYDLKMDKSIDPDKFARYLFKEHRIMLPKPSGDGLMKLTINETLFNRSLDEIIETWKLGLEKAKI